MTQPPGSLRARTLPWVAASLPFAFLVVWFWDRGPGLNADDYALTLMHAEAILEGRPYGETGYIPTRLDAAPPVQPPVLPVIVAGVEALTGGFHWWSLRLAMALLALPFFLLAGLYFARTHGRWIGIAITVMLAVGLTARQPEGATHVQSDLAFASFIWSALYLLEGRTPASWWRVLAVFALSSLAMGTRFLGAALLPAITLLALVGPREERRRLAVPVVIWGLGGVAVVAAAGWSFVAMQVPPDAAVVVGRLPAAILLYGRGAAEAHLYPLPWNVANDLFHVGSLSLAAIGLIRWTATSWRSGAWLFAAVYLVLLLVVWNRSARYLVPLYPILVFGFLYGVQIALGVVRRGMQELRARRLAAGTGIGVSAAALALLLASEPRRGGYLWELPDARAAFTHLTAEGPLEQTRVAFIQPRVLSWSTGLSAMTIPGVGPEPMMAELDRLDITHVVLDHIGLEPGRTARLRETVAAFGCRFERSLLNDSFEVYRVLPPCPADTPS